MERCFYVYMMTNKPYGTLYVGITNDLQGLNPDWNDLFEAIAN
jgi:predicted GIY-YIG superfamily endonuclease